ncbi:MAG: hypothetical protein V9G14_00480 [Cypionkella sp.]
MPAGAVNFDQEALHTIFFGLANGCHQFFARGPTAAAKTTVSLVHNRAFDRQNANINMFGQQTLGQFLPRIAT